MLRLRERGLPFPVAGVLMSPWTDLAATGASYVSRADADPIHARTGRHSLMGRFNHQRLCRLTRDPHRVRLFRRQRKYVY